MFPPLRLREALALGGLSVRELLVRTWTKINEHEIWTRAAAVSYYAMLALVPFLALVLTVTVRLLPDVTGRSGKVVGIGNLTVGQLRTTLQSMFPREAYDVIHGELANLQKAPHPGLISISVLVTIWLASSLFAAVIDAMNRIYGVVETRPIWRIRLTAIVMTIVQAVILVGSLVTIVAWPQIMGLVGLDAPAAALATVVQWGVVLLMVLFSFALALYFGPDADQKWEWITPGSLVGAVVFLIETFALRVYVQNFANYNKTYGSLGGVMVLLLWFWLSSLVVLSAAEVNKIIEDASPLGKAYGQKVDPAVAPDLASLEPEPAKP